ncbi:MAG: diacylglycerol kinase family protein [Cyclobacteriaceae bacterium]
MNGEHFSIRKRIKSFKYAWSGLVLLIKEEHNSRIHLVAASIAVCLGIILKISFQEWIAITFSIGLVISLELINSAIENLSDFVTQDESVFIKKTKDLAAGGVLVGAGTALIIGAIIFLPKLLNLIP